MKAVIGDWSTDIFPTDAETVSECRRGQGADTCIWLVAGGGGFMCTFFNRNMALYDRWKAGLTTAKRDGCERVKNFNPSAHEELEVEIPALAARTLATTK